MMVSISTGFTNLQLLPGIPKEYRRMELRQLHWWWRRQKRWVFWNWRWWKCQTFADWSTAFQNKCREQCLENCSCIAYAYETGIGCMSWIDKQIDTKQLSSSGVELYIHLAYSELGKLFIFFMLLCENYTSNYPLMVQLNTIWNLVL